MKKMDKNKKRKKPLMLSVAMAALMLSPLTMNAQYRENKYGIQPWFGTSLMGREGGGVCDYNLHNQQFGLDANGGYELSNQTFGQNAPMGNGLAIFLMASAGYATIKTKKNNKSTNKK